MLRVRDFSFAFDGPPTLHGISFSLGDGGYLSIIGPNGAGKSTLLKCLMRLHERGQGSGEILVDGRPLAEYGQRELARLIGYVPQAGGWIPPFTVEELLRLSRYPYSRSTISLGAKDREAVGKALALTGMEALADRPLRNISGGERQKAFLAAALAQETRILLLDEPASFLDPKHAADLHHLLKRLNQEQGLTMLTVTHDLNHPLAAGGLALALRQGRQVFFGPVEGLLENGILEAAYQHEFTYFIHPRTGRPAVLAE